MCLLLLFLPLQRMVKGKKSATRAFWSRWPFPTSFRSPVPPSADIDNQLPMPPHPPRPPAGRHLGSSEEAKLGQGHTGWQPQDPDPLVPPSQVAPQLYRHPVASHSTPSQGLNFPHTRARFPSPPRPPQPRPTEHAGRERREG